MLAQAAGPLYDMHCHLDFASNALSAASQIDALGAGAFAVAVLPTTEPLGNASFERDALLGSKGKPRAEVDAKAESGPTAEEAPIVEGTAQHTATTNNTASLVKWGIGLHPWWVASGRAGQADVEAVTNAIQNTVYIGEVGLDFGKRYGDARAEQTACFEAIAHECARVGGRVLSIHSVAAAHEALSILEQHRVLDCCACIFHWFSDSSDALARAVRQGCYFSVGRLMLRSKRGREYARQIPLDQLLFETDMPEEGGFYDVAAMQRELYETCQSIAQMRGVDESALAKQISATSRRLLLWD